MDRVFVCGTHDRESIASELIKLLHEKGCSITDLQVVKLEEGGSLDYDALTFDDIMELVEIILVRLKIFKAACIMIDKGVDDKHFSVMYLMFVNTDDPNLFTALSMVE